MSGGYNRKDSYYEKAKSAGYRSRAAYKLIELDKKYGLLKPGTKVLDLGSWPGGWVQVAAERVGPSGLVVGVDLVALEPVGFPQVHLLTGDARDESFLASARELAGGQFDVLISDMSPKLTGIKEADQAGTVACAELALWLTGQVVRPGGTFVAKVFKGGDTDAFVKAARPLFNKLARVELDSTRKTSNEFYIIGLGLKG
jgi:23S rRNA (uridine2552-2'-O)-methyltransferase